MKSFEEKYWKCRKVFFKNIKFCFSKTKIKNIHFYDISDMTKHATLAGNLLKHITEYFTILCFYDDQQLFAWFQWIKALLIRIQNKQIQFQSHSNLLKLKARYTTIQLSDNPVKQFTECFTYLRCQADGQSCPLLPYIKAF